MSFFGNQDDEVRDSVLIGNLDCDFSVLPAGFRVVAVSEEGFPT